MIVLLTVRLAIMLVEGNTAKALVHIGSKQSALDAMPSSWR